MTNLVNFFVLSPLVSIQHGRQRIAALDSEDILHERDTLSDHTHTQRDAVNIVICDNLRRKEEATCKKGKIKAEGTQTNCLKNRSCVKLEPEVKSQQRTSDKLLENSSLRFKCKHALQAYPVSMDFLRP